VDLGAKLQIGGGQRIAVLDAPTDVVLELPDDIVRVETAADADAVLVFVRDGTDLDGRSAADAVEAARDDRLAWLLYPKAGQLDTDLNRDRLAAALQARGTRAARQVSVDAVWSALRFRPASGT
jgi:Protein of unknown function (DUF3052)